METKKLLIELAKINAVIDDLQKEKDEAVMYRSEITREIALFMQREDIYEKLRDGDNTVLIGDVLISVKLSDGEIVHYSIKLVKPDVIVE